MKIFSSKHRKKEQQQESPLADKIARDIMFRQHQLAGYLNQKVRRYPRKGMVIAFLSFGGVFSAYCLYLIIHHLF